MALAFVRASCASDARDDLDPLPPWNYAEMMASATTGIPPSHVKDARLLAWHTQQDGKPVRFDAALIWLHVAPAPKPDVWLLVMLARHPLDADAVWVTSFQGHQWSPVIVYARPPRNKEVYSFIDGHWDFEPDNSVTERLKLVNKKWVRVRRAGFSVVAGAIRSKTWIDVIGEKPVKFHRGESHVEK
jgi:hypothetical protein